MLGTWEGKESGHREQDTLSRGGLLVPAAASTLAHVFPAAEPRTHYLHLYIHCYSRIIDLDTELLGRTSTMGLPTEVLQAWEACDRTDTLFVLVCSVFCMYIFHDYSLH